tara:strand:- start:2212 stop:2832 length:621 start_codon:yes stop_codon:yes gene_type:complete
VSIAIETFDKKRTENELTTSAVDLLNQQIWYWGRDICKEEGNLLLEIGFERIEPPPTSDAVSSVYSLELPGDRNIILRGYGIFYGCYNHGGIFLRRYEFIPGYSSNSKLQNPPWLDTDLPQFRSPLKNELRSYTFLLTELITWIQNYEKNILKNYGLGYRHSVLEEWDNGKRQLINPVDVVGGWQKIKETIQEGFFMKNRSIKANT